MGITFELVFILLLIVANGVFAMSEIAVVSARKARLQQWANEGNAKARVALELANAPGRFLSTVQIGITLVGILAGAFGGATIAEELATRLKSIPPLELYGEALALGIVVVGITYLSLVIGELVPKRFALNRPEQIAAAMAVPMRALSVIASPAVHLLSASTDAVLRVLGSQPSTEPPITEEEIQVLIDQGAQAGVFEAAEQDMVEGVIRLSNRRIGALMTPRMQIVSLDLDETPDEIRRKISSSTHSRFVVIQGSLDNVLGVVHVKDLLARTLAGQPLDLKGAWQQPLFVPSTMSALRLLELFKTSGTDVALVIDEHGGLQGVVTTHDVLEAIVGDISRASAPRAFQRADGSWLVDGLLAVDEFREIFHIGKLPGEERGAYHTLGGFVMAQLGRIPALGDRFEWNRLRFEVMDMDGLRVDKVLVVEVEGK